MSGYVLKLARQSAGLTQDRLAESLGMDVSTIQGWESGRRPLAAMNTGDFIRVRAHLVRLGAPPSTGRHLYEAVAADIVLSAAITAGRQWVNPGRHPLAVSVHRRSITNLITWPLTGELPPQLTEFTPRTPRRGPVASGPTLYPDERIQFCDHMMAISQQSTLPEHALLRRQAVYLLGFDHRPHVADWLQIEWQRAGKRKIDDTDINGLLEARSASVALSAMGDTTYLDDFVAAMSSTRAELANLNYWAYWIGELTEDQPDDTFMLDLGLETWSGVRLFKHLARRLEQRSCHLPLNLYSLHSLVAARPSLLTDWPDSRSRLAGALNRVADSGNLSPARRDQVSGLHYALRIAER